MIPRIPTQSPALIKLARNEIVRELGIEFAVVFAFFAVVLAIDGLFDVIKTVLERLI